MHSVFVHVVKFLECKDEFLLQVPNSGPQNVVSYILSDDWHNIVNNIGTS